MKTKQDTLNEAIDKKLEDWKRIRRNRINASERLKKYSQRWAFVIFLFNIEAVGFTIISLRFPSSNSSEAVFTGIFSIYVILLQYFLATLNYEARSLKFHYEEIQIQDLRLKLKHLRHVEHRPEDRSEDKYQGILREYQMNLYGYENHADIDDKTTNNDKKTWDFNLENLFIALNFVVVVFVLCAFIGIYVFS